MKKILLSCSLSLLLATCFAQTAEDYAERGDALYRAGLYEQALTEYDTAIALKPGWMDPYLHKGMALEFLRRFSDGIDTYNTLLKKDAGNLLIIARRGICYMKLRQYERALPDLKLAADALPEIRSNLGLCRVALGDMSGMADLNEAAVLLPQSDEILYNRGLAKMLAEQFAEAITDFRKVIELRPDRAESYYGIGLCEMKLGHLQRGCSLWKEAVEKGYKRAQAMIDEYCK